MTSHIWCSVILLLKDFMPVPLTPSLMTLNSSPSVDPCFQSASDRFEGFGFSCSPIVPSPAPVLPWQLAQFFSYSCLPAAIDEASAATGFFCLAASGCVCAPGVDGCSCAITIAPASASAMYHIDPLLLFSPAPTV